MGLSTSWKIDRETFQGQKEVISIDFLIGLCLMTYTAMVAKGTRNAGTEAQF